MDEFGLWVSIIGTVVTIVCTFLTIYYQKKAKSIKDEVYARLNDFDLTGFSSSFKFLVDEIARCPNKEGNNRGGKLKSVLDRLQNELSSISEFCLNFGEQERKILLDEKSAITEYVIDNKENPTIDILNLSKMLSKMYEDICQYVDAKLQEHKY